MIRPSGTCRKPPATPRRCSRHTGRGWPGTPPGAGGRAPWRARGGAPGTLHRSAQQAASDP
eukprot:5502559-Lingulodinium_polyedra.AAC.1